jgi:hypothetical protein
MLGPRGMRIVGSHTQARVYINGDSCSWFKTGVWRRLYHQTRPSRLLLIVQTVRAIPDRD